MKGQPHWTIGDCNCLRAHSTALEGADSEFQPLGSRERERERKSSELLAPMGRVRLRRRRDRVSHSHFGAKLHL